MVLLNGFENQNLLFEVDNDLIHLYLGEWKGFVHKCSLCLNETQDLLLLNAVD